MQPDELDEYLKGNSPLSRRYRRESAPVPPQAVDQRVREMARGTRGNSSWLAPLAFAASVLLSVALVLALVFGPQKAKRIDDVPRVMRTSFDSTAWHAREPHAWLSDIAALRRSGHTREADAEYRRFRSAYPHYPRLDP